MSKKMMIFYSFPFNFLWKSLMTLMTVTLMTGKRPKHLFVFLMKLLPCLSHCFRSPIVGLYQQWALMILHNLDSD